MGLQSVNNENTVGIMHGCKIDLKRKLKAFLKRLIKKKKIKAWERFGTEDLKMYLGRDPYLINGSSSFQTLVAISRHLQDLKQPSVLRKVKLVIFR
jgi:hypothetical protein